MIAFVARRLRRALIARYMTRHGCSMICVPWKPQSKVSVAKYTPEQRKKRRRALQPVTVPRDAGVISR